jgi:hypothetical protein
MLPKITITGLSDFKTTSSKVSVITNAISLFNVYCFIKKNKTVYKVKLKQINPIWDRFGYKCIVTIKS